MNAHCNQTFSKGFFLTEESITKICDIISDRTNEAKDKIRLKIYRSDNLVYETEDKSKLIEEENAVRNRILQVLIFLETEDLSLSLDFNQSKDVSLKIESKERDLALLLSSDLKEYLNTEVLKFRDSKWTSKKTSGFLMPLFMLVLLSFTMLLTVLDNSPT